MSNLEAWLMWVLPYEFPEFNGSHVVPEPWITPAGNAPLEERENNRSAGCWEDIYGNKTPQLEVWCRYDEHWSWSQIWSLLCQHSCCGILSASHFSLLGLVFLTFLTGLRNYNIPNYYQVPIMCQAYFKCLTHIILFNLHKDLMKHH